jgi:hypothetical protein
MSVIVHNAQFHWIAEYSFCTLMACDTNLQSLCYPVLIGCHMWVSVLGPLLRQFSPFFILTAYNFLDPFSYLSTYTEVSTVKSSIHIFSS